MSASPSSFERPALSMDALPSLDPLAPLVKVPDLWFDDGNLILQAEDSVFKIYRGLLCARSSVFADMFAFPPPKEGNGTVDGCPFIHTYDSAQDMTYFLKALLDSKFFEPPPAPTEIPILAGVLRLSSKYDVHHLRLRAMSHLLTTYPSTLAEWHARDTHRTIPGVENTPFVVLNLAREFDMPWLIPPVAYCISSHDLAKTFHGAEWPLPKSCVGHEEVAPHLTSSPNSEVEQRAGAIVKLGWGDQKMCIMGRHDLLVKQSKIALRLAKPVRARLPSTTTPTATGTPGTMTPAANPTNVPITFHHNAPNGPATAAPHAPNPSQTPQLQAPGAVPAPQAAGAAPQAVPVLPDPLGECTAPERCQFMRFRCAEMLTRWGTAGILDFYNEQCATFARGFCLSCLEAFKRDCESGAQEMWDALPRLFGLESWEELERIKQLTMR